MPCFTLYFSLLIGFRLYFYMYLLLRFNFERERIMECKICICFVQDSILVRKGAKQVHILINKGTCLLSDFRSRNRKAYLKTSPDTRCNRGHEVFV